jgi:predicted ATPase/DNA-binding SARP family transcriptional activator
MSADHTLHVRLLGGFELSYRGQPVAGFAQARLQSLLAYLLLHPDAPVLRQQLAFAFWPDTTDEQARSNLRTLLHRLIEALPDGASLLTVDRHTVRWHDSTAIAVDVARFEAALASARQAEQAGSLANVRHWLEEALAAYAGELLPGCYDDWISPIRERLSQAALVATERLVLLLEEAGEYRAAVDYAQRLLRHDPLHEPSYRHLMRLHAANGDRVEVVRAYNTCVAVLRRELSVPSATETRAAYQEALARAATAHRAALAVSLPRHTSRGGLPQPTASLIGREREAAEVGRLLEAHPLVTLTGTAGVGKTCLALHVARRLQPSFADGAWWVDLEAINDEECAAQAIATALGVREMPGRDTMQGLTEHLHDRRTLIVLDNCEHLAPQVGQFAHTLLQAAPHARILVTSQRSLGVAGEIAWRVPSLAVPDALPGQLPETGTTGTPVRAPDQVASVQLFAARAQSVLPTFALTDRNAPVIAHICRRLNGIPLAIELAATRIRALTPDQIAARLDNVFALLDRQAPAAGPTRRQTMWAAMEWSHGLLSQEERILFRRLAVFASSFTLEAAEVVCAGHGLAAERVVGLLAGLEDKSLVEAEPILGRLRFRIHEVLRQYAGAKLAEAGEADRLRARHLDYYARLVAEAAPHLVGEHQAEWLDQLTAEYDNLAAALATSQEESARAEIGMKMVGGLWRFWITRGHFQQGRHWARSMLAASDPTRATAGHLGALRAAGVLARYQTDYAEARVHFERALVVAQALGDRPAYATITRELGNIAQGEGDYPTALRCYEESLALCREIGDRQGESAVQGNLGLVSWQQGDPAMGRRHLEACLTLRRELSDEVGIAYALHLLAEIAWSESRPIEAQRLNEESFAMRRRLGDRWGIAYSLDSLAVIAGAQGDRVRARSLFSESLLLFNELGSVRGLVDTLDHLAALLADEGCGAEAVQLMGAADAQRTTIRAARPPNAHAEYERLLAGVRGQLGDEAFRAAWLLGQAMTTERAVRYALELTAM